MTGLGTSAAAPSPAAVGTGDHEGDVVAGIDEGPQRADRHLGRAEEDEPQGVSPVAVAAGEAEGPLAQGPHGLLALDRVEALQQQDAVEVVDLVLEHAAHQLVALDRERLAVEVEAGEEDPVGPHDRPVEVGHRQAALGVLPLPVVAR